MRWVVSICLLTGIYLLILTSLDPWDIAAGFLVSSVLVVAFRSYLGLTRAAAGPGAVERLRWLVPFVLSVTWEVATGAFRVAAMVMHLRPIARAQFVEISVDDRTTNGVALTALVTTLSPGSVLVDIDWSRRMMLLHVLDDSNPEEIQSAFRDLYEKYQRHVVP